MRKSVSLNPDNVLEPVAFRSVKLAQLGQDWSMTSPRKIQASAWATTHGLAGRNLEEIRLHELTWQAWSNHNLRALTRGRYVSINLARSIQEATFISFLLQHVREHKLDLDQSAERFCAESGIRVTSTMAENAKKSFRMKSQAVGCKATAALPDG